MLSAGLDCLQGVPLSQWVAQLCSDSLSEQLAAAETLCSYAQQSDGNTRSVIDAGGVSSFSSLLLTSNSAATAAAAAAGPNSSSSSSSSSSHSRSRSSHSSSLLQRAAAQALDALIQRDSACCLRVLSAGVVPVLVDLLWCEDEPTQRAATSALTGLVQDDEVCKAAVVQAGAIVPAVGLLAEDEVSPETQARAALMLHRLTCGSHACKAEAWEAGAIQAFVKALQNPLATTLLQARAAAFLNNIAATEEGAAAAVREAGAIPELVKLLGSLAPQVQENAVWALHCLVTKDEQCCACFCAITSSHAALLSVLTRRSSSRQLHRYALGALLATIKHVAERADAAGRADPALRGAVAALIPLLHSSDVEVQDMSAQVLHVICVAGRKWCRQLQEFGGIQPVLGLLGAADRRLPMHGAAILAAMTKLDAGSRAVIKDAGAAPLLKAVMTDGVDAEARNYAAAALSRLPGISWFSR
jgi:hypothetical protein